MDSKVILGFRSKIYQVLIFTFLCSFSFSQEKDTEWDDYFMPGVGYKVYQPKNAKDFGTYSGVVTEFVIHGRAKGVESNSSGPARIKTYGNLSIMTSSNQSAKDLFFCKFRT